MRTPTIERIDVFPVRIPITRTFAFASGSAGAVGETAPHVFAKVTDSEGRTGWGEGRPNPAWSYETLESVVGTVRDHLGPAVLGIPITDRAGLHRAMRRRIGIGPSTGMPVAKAVVDIAVHDLCAKAAGMSLRSFLGGSDERDRVELSYTVTAHEPSVVREDVRRARAEGFAHINFKVAVERETDVAVAAAIREEAGDEAFVWADANQGYTLHEARQAAPRFADVGVDVLEQPLPADAEHLWPELRRSVALPLAADEASVSPTDLFRLASRGVVDYLVLKITRSGGIWPTLAQIGIAEAAGLGLLVSGLTDSMIVKLAVCQVAAAAGCTGPAGLNGSQFIDDAALFPGKREVEHDGAVLLPHRPGIGLEPDEDALRELSRDPAPATVA